VGLNFSGPDGFPSGSNILATMAQLMGISISSIISTKGKKQSACVDRLKSNPHHHEILSHSYGHIDYSDGATTQDIAYYDMSFSKKLLEKALSTEVDGFVYPCNVPCYEEQLLKEGYRIYRGGSARLEYRFTLSH